MKTKRQKTLNPSGPKIRGAYTTTKKGYKICHCDIDNAILVDEEKYIQNTN